MKNHVAVKVIEASVMIQADPQSLVLDKVFSSVFFFFQTGGNGLFQGQRVKKYAKRIVVHLEFEIVELASHVLRKAGPEKDDPGVVIDLVFFLLGFELCPEFPLRSIFGYNISLDLEPALFL